MAKKSETEKQEIPEVEENIGLDGLTDEELTGDETITPDEEKEQEAPPEQEEASPEPEAPVEESPVVFPSDLLARAGMQPGQPEALGFTSPAELERALVLAELRAPKQAQESQEPPEPEYEPIDFTLDAEEFGQEAYQKSKAASDTLNARLKAAEETARKAEQAAQALLQQQQTSQLDVQIDAAIAALGQPESFGEGPMANLPPGSPAFTNRQRLCQMADAIAAVDSQNGRPLDLPDVMKRAYRALGFENSQKDHAKASNVARNERGQFIARTTNRQAPPAPPTERARKAVEDFFRSRGIPFNDDMEEDEALRESL